VDAIEVPSRDRRVHEGLAIDVAGSIRSARVIDVPSRIVSERGAPDYLRDNGPEFVSHALLAWIRSQGIGTALIEPGEWCRGKLQWQIPRRVFEPRMVPQQSRTDTTKYALIRASAIRHWPSSRRD
jgi:hypothetical protein